MSESIEYNPPTVSNDQNISNEQLIKTDDNLTGINTNTPFPGVQIINTPNQSFNFNNNNLIYNPNLLNYEDSIIADFDKMLYYDDNTNCFLPGIDGILPYPYVYNPTKLKLDFYCSCDCCQCKINYCKGRNCLESILSFLPLYLHGFIEVRTVYEYLSVFNGITFPILFLKFLWYSLFGNYEKSPNMNDFFRLIFIYLIALLIQLYLTYYSLPKNITYDQFIEKMKNKFNILPRIYFSDNRKVIPFKYKYYKDISGILAIDAKYCLIELISRPGTYIIDNDSLKHYYRTTQKIFLNGALCKFYINYENKEIMNNEFNYDNQTLYSMFSSHEINELLLQKNELVFLSPDNYEKWSKEALIYFFSLQGYILNGIFLKNLNVKQYKIRKAILINTPSSELEEQMSKYIPTINYQGNEYKFENEGKMSDLNDKYYDNWEKEFKNEKDIIA